MEATQSITHADPAGNYTSIIADDAGLLDDCTTDEMDDLAILMDEITQYSNVAFITVDDNPYDSEYYAEIMNQKLFGPNTINGIVFLIDMDNRMIAINAQGDTRHIITPSYCDTITDNVYRSASKGDYYACAYQAFEQIYASLQGERIAQPMKYICNSILAIVLAMLINFRFVAFSSHKRKATNRELLQNIFSNVNITNTTSTFLRQTKTYSPESSGSGGSSGGGSSGGGGGGGGGSSSGSHSF